MVNIWDYEIGENIKITDTDGEIFVGRIVSIFDVDETYNDEDDITIDVNGRYIGFVPSEIKKIERVR